MVSVIQGLIARKGLKAKDLKAKGLKIFCNFLISLLIIHTFLQNLGKKVDTWFSVDRFTGSKQGSLTFNGCLKNEEDTCPNLGPSNFLVGRTEYNIMMYDIYKNISHFYDIFQCCPRSQFLVIICMNITN